VISSFFYRLLFFFPTVSDEDWAVLEFILGAELLGMVMKDKMIYKTYGGGEI
jgi:hypothetical protein